MNFNAPQPILGGIALGLFMAISVGPTIFEVIRLSLKNSYRAGIAFVLGVSISDLIFIVLANTAAPLLASLHHYENLIAIIGGIILVVMGLTAFFRKAHVPDETNLKPIITTKHYSKIIASGFLINSFNPGVIFNWLTFVTLIANKTVSYRVLFFSSCLIIVLGIDFLKVFLAHSLRARLTVKTVGYLQKTSALMLMFLGILILIYGFLNSH